MIFDWDIYRTLSKSLSQPEKRLIALCLNQYIEGNSDFEDMNSTEIRRFHDAFHVSWIVQQALLKTPLNDDDL